MLFVTFDILHQFHFQLKPLCRHLVLSFISNCRPFKLSLYCHFLLQTLRVILSTMFSFIDIMYLVKFSFVDIFQMQIFYCMCLQSLQALYFLIFYFHFQLYGMLYSLCYISVSVVDIILFDILVPFFVVRYVRASFSNAYRLHCSKP